MNTEDSEYTENKRRRSRAGARRLTSLAQERIRIDGRAARPRLARRATQNAEMQMGRVDRSVPRRADVADHLAASERHALLESVRISVEVSVEEHEAVGGIARIYHDATGLAVEQLSQRAVGGRQHFGASRRRDVQGLVRVAAAWLSVRVAQLRPCHTTYGNVEHRSELRELRGNSGGREAGRARGGRDLRHG